MEEWFISNGKRRVFFQRDTEVSKEVCSPSLNIYEGTKVISFCSLSPMASAL